MDVDTFDYFLCVCVCVLGRNVFDLHFMLYILYKSPEFSFELSSDVYWVVPSEFLNFFFVVYKGGVNLLDSWIIARYRNIVPE